MIKKILSAVSKISKNNGLAAFSIFLIGLISQFKSLHFYFWWDDFSMLYNAQNKVCLFEWPFTSNCPPYQFLYNIFGYNSLPYFVLGIILRILLGYFFYIFTKRLFKSEIALLASFLIVSIGGEDMMMTFYSIWENSALCLLMIVLIKLYDWNIKKRIDIVVAIIAFGISLALFPIYSTAHIGIVFVFLLLVKSKLRNKLSLLVPILFFILITVVTYVLVPKFQGGDATLAIKESNSMKLTMSDVFRKSKDFCIASTSFVFTDYFERHIPSSFRTKHLDNIRAIVGFIAYLSLLYLILRKIKIGEDYKVGLFGLSWILFQYIPRGLVTEYAFSSVDRHIFFPYLGFALILGFILNKTKQGSVPLLILGLLIISNIFHTNELYGRLVWVNTQRAKFHKTLRQYVDKVPRNSVFFFNAPRGKAGEELGTFVRAGMLNHEASIATTLGININDITLTTDSDELNKFISEGKVKPDNYFGFYYDGQKLIDQTIESRMILKGMVEPIKQKMYLSQTTIITEDIEQKEWAGQNPDLKFNIEKLKTILPTKIYFVLEAQMPDISVPYTQGCVNCVYNQELFSKSLEYLTLSKQLKKQFQVVAEEGYENTSPSYLNDNNLSTYWLPPRSDWYAGKKPVITLNFNKKVNIEGLVIYSGSKIRMPTMFKILIDGKEKQNTVVDYSGKKKVLFEQSLASSVEITILNTLGDSPLVEEVGVIPTNFGDIDLDEIDRIGNSPAELIKTEKDKKILKQYLTLGGNACLKWEDSVYGVGKKDFNIFLDGTIRKYVIEIPALGNSTPNFYIGCLNYPVKIKLFEVGGDYIFQR